MANDMNAIWARLQEQHRKAFDNGCWKCDEPWPCPTTIVLDALREQAEEIERLDAQIKDREGEAAQVRRHYLHEKVEREKAEAEMDRRERDTACAYPGAVPGHWKAEAERQVNRAEKAEAELAAERERAERLEKLLRKAVEAIGYVPHMVISDEGSRFVGDTRREIEKALRPAAPPEKPWRLRLICCGRDDGTLYFDTAEEVDAAREAYTSGEGVNPRGYSAHPSEGGHKRAAIKERTSV